MTTVPLPVRQAVVSGIHHVNPLIVAVLRSPAGAWVASPVTGYMAVLTTTGRRSGRERHTPLNYAIRDGCVYLLAGYGPGTDWLANLRAHPHVTLRLPGRTLTGLAEVVDDPDEAGPSAVAVARNAGAALALEGVNPLRVDDDELRVRLADRPVIRVVALSHARPGAATKNAAGDLVVTPTGHDPGGWLWVLPHIVAPVLGYAAWRLSRRALRS